MSKVMLMGLGRVGWLALEYLVQDPRCPELVCCDLHSDGKLTVANALIGAGMFNLYPSVRYRQLDVSDGVAVEQTIREEQPDVVIDCTVLMPMHGFYKLPREQFDILYSAKFGAWLPCQLALAYRIAQAIKRSGVKAHLMTCGIADLVNPALATVDLAPAVGVGNIKLNEAALRFLVARRLSVPMEVVRVYLVSHHAWVVYPRDPAYKKTPYFLKIMVNDRDVTDRFDTDQLMWDAIRLYPPAPSTVFYTITAKSLITNMYALLGSERVFTHAPGPKGLPGGYPIYLSNKGAELALPDGVTREQAVAINTEAQRISEGIESIQPDGTCVWTDYAHDVFKKLLGFERTSFHVSECFEVAQELMARYRNFEKKFCS